MKIGLFGGTFDPIHWGHLRSAEEVREAFSLDRLLFVPTSIPPHKRAVPTSPARDRVKMVRLAIAKNPGFRLSSVEISRPGKSYSIDTVRHFARKCSGKNSLYFVLGLDAFREIGSWKDYRDLFPLSHWIVTSRPGSGGALSLGRMPVAVKNLFCYDKKKRAYRHQSGTYLFFLKISDIGISSSEIRNRVSRGRSIRYLVPLEVESYIRKRGLYQARQEGR
ncbi:MAG: nicotinate-nucleotide adenylyltransferase [Deltaproteobacteria bacterium]|nr:nicotinate-nucleotide adenylyltransferase [Deltaproteobacteria bacterium]